MDLSASGFDGANGPPFQQPCVGAAGGGEDSSSVEALTWMFRCYICMDPLRDARLCPHCSKMCCFGCIRRWLCEQRSQFCPHCRAPVNIQEFVHCRWVEEVMEQLASLQVSRDKDASHSQCKKKDACDSHPEKQVDVFCQTCSQPVCSQCALFGSGHSRHNFIPLDGVYSEHVSQVKKEVDKLQQRAKDLMTALEDLDKNIEMVRSAKEEKAREIRNAVEHMVARLDGQLKTKLFSLMGQRTKLREAYEEYEALVELSEAATTSWSMNELISKSTDLVRRCQAAASKPMAVYNSCPVQTEFTSELVPAYDCSTFVLRQFSTRQRNAEPVYSPHLRVNGLVWRLKVYPDGNGAVRGSYLSVFLELNAGHPEPSKYDYRIELVHQKDPARNFQREFSSEFEIGECWGYNRFFRLDLLASEGFLDSQHDTLGLIFHVRAPTYHQKCRDQTWYIRDLERSQGVMRDSSSSGNLAASLGPATAASQNSVVPSSSKQNRSQGSLLALAAGSSDASTSASQRHDVGGFQAASRPEIKAKVKVAAGGESGTDDTDGSDNDSSDDEVGLLAEAGITLSGSGIEEGLSPAPGSSLGESDGAAVRAFLAAAHSRSGDTSAGGGTSADVTLSPNSSELDDSMRSFLRSTSRRQHFDLIVPSTRLLNLSTVAPDQDANDEEEEDDEDDEDEIEHATSHPSTVAAANSTNLASIDSGIVSLRRRSLSSDAHDATVAATSSKPQPRQ